jgi:SAM-dependent methyltransferase
MAQRYEQHVATVPLSAEKSPDRLGVARTALTPALGSPVASGPAVVKIKSYEQLDGGQGRQVFFRPQRYGRSDLGPIRPVVHVTTSPGATYDVELVDVSQNGVAVEWPDGIPVELGAIVPQLSVTFDQHEAYRGEARVGSIRDLDGKTVVGVSFVESLMNVDDVLQLRDVKAYGGQSKGLGLRDRPWRSEGNERFKAQVAELRLFLDDAHTQLTELEKTLPWNVVHSETDSPARAELVRLVQGELVTEFVRLAEGIDAAWRTAAPSERQPLKEFSRGLVHHYLMQSPGLARCTQKPLGYPGDYEVMNFIYSNQFAGPTLFAKAVNLAGVSTKPCVSVRNRKDVIKKRLAGLIDAAAAKGQPLQVLSIAAGPAQELYELLQEQRSIPIPVRLVLFDQDRGALTYAYNRLKPLADGRGNENVQIVYLHDSIKRLLRDPTIFESFSPFDAIFASGLFDYLELPTAVTLARHLHSNLRPGGTVYIGNMVPTNPNRWMMEFHFDWFLIYRTRAEMMDMARLAAPDARAEIIEEPAGVNPFVAITKQG